MTWWRRRPSAPAATSGASPRTRTQTQAVGRLQSDLAVLAGDVLCIRRDRAADDTAARDSSQGTSARRRVVMHVFISHVAEDARVALAIALGLEDAGYSTWCFEV